MDVNSVHIREHIKENRTSGVVTSLTIKCAAYALTAETTHTGDGNHLTSREETYKRRTISGKAYYDYDNCTILTSESFTYTVPTDEQTSITQDLNKPVANHSQQVEYRDKRASWYSSYQNSTAWVDCCEALYTKIRNL